MLHPHRIVPHPLSKISGVPQEYYCYLGHPLNNLCHCHLEADVLAFVMLAYQHGMLPRGHHPRHLTKMRKWIAHLHKYSACVRDLDHHLYFPASIFQHFTE